MPAYIHILGRLRIDPQSSATPHCFPTILSNDSVALLEQTSFSHEICCFFCVQEHRLSSHRGPSDRRSCFRWLFPDGHDSANHSKEDPVPKSKLIFKITSCILSIDYLYNMLLFYSTAILYAKTLLVRATIRKAVSQKIHPKCFTSRYLSQTIRLNSILRK